MGSRFASEPRGEDAKTEPTLAHRGGGRVALGSGPALFAPQARSRRRERPGPDNKCCYLEEPVPVPGLTFRMRTGPYDDTSGRTCGACASEGSEEEHVPPASRRREGKNIYHPRSEGTPEEHLRPGSYKGRRREERLRTGAFDDTLGRTRTTHALKGSGEEHVPPALRRGEGENMYHPRPEGERGRTYTTRAPKGRRKNTFDPAPPRAEEGKNTCEPPPARRTLEA